MASVFFLLSASIPGHQHVQCKWKILKWYIEVIPVLEKACAYLILCLWKCKSLLRVFKRMLRQSGPSLERKAIVVNMDLRGRGTSTWAVTAWNVEMRFPTGVCQAALPPGLPPCIPWLSWAQCCPPLLLLWDSSSHPCPSGKGPSYFPGYLGVISQGMMLKLYTSNTRRKLCFEDRPVGESF